MTADQDKWSNRSTFNCESCMWFMEKRPYLVLEGGKPPEKAEDLPRSLLGRCRRHAPVSAGHGWPVVYKADWCGDHKLR